MLLYLHCLLTKHQHMPRKERTKSGTGIYHVMLRGINKQDIFEDDEDYIQFLKILNGLVDRHDDDGHLSSVRLCDTMPVIRRLEKTNLYEFVTMPVDDKSILDVDYGIGGIITDDEIKEKILVISGLQQPTEIQKLEKKKRNTILKQLCEYGANIRQISRITGISYGVIYRAKSGS